MGRDDRVVPGAPAVIRRTAMRTDVLPRIARATLPGIEQAAAVLLTTNSPDLGPKAIPLGPNRPVA